MSMEHGKAGNEIMSEMTAIIVLTLGSVQSYISQARRTQDLWQGSRILSYLAGVGVQKAKEYAGDDSVIYPVVDENQRDQYASIPNRLVIAWDGDLAEAEKCARRIAGDIKDAWLELSRNTRDYFLNEVEDCKKAIDIWERQDENWLECYWVVTPTKPDRNYAKNMQRANAEMGARKLLRNFPQIYEDGRKCSITGEHEILHDGSNGNDFWERLREKQANLAQLGKHERLSAISAIKRFAHEEEKDDQQQWWPINPALQIDHRYPSTSSIAAVPFKYAVLKAIADNPSESEHLLHALQAFIKTLLDCIEVGYNTRDKAAKALFFVKHGNFNPEYFPPIEKISNLTIKRSAVTTRAEDWATQLMCIDGDFLFEDTLIVKTIEEYLPDLNNHQRKHLQPLVTAANKALKNLLSAASNSKPKIPRPQPYLVILSMDGDHMGKTLGALDKKQHGTFSQTLSNFAQKDVISLVEERHLGRVVYAGGDDVLALLPIRDALQVADRLRSAFQEAVALSHLKNYEGEPVTVTASTGLAYVHHTHNLQDAVHAAKHAQDIAKDRYGRNAIAVEFLRRSGEPRSMGHKWTADSGSLVDHIRGLISAFGNGLSRNLPYDVAQITYSMADEDVPEAARRAELERILKRRLSGKKKDDEKKREAETLRDHIWALVNDAPGMLEKRWRNAQHWLELARFIAQKEDDL